jgi:hypothetical protein
MTQIVESAGGEMDVLSGRINGDEIKMGLKKHKIWLEKEADNV